MARSISFVIEGEVDTRITVTELEGGQLQFDVEVLGTGSIGDLRGLFFDLNGFTADDGLNVSQADDGLYSYDANNTEFGEESVDTVTRDVNLKGEVSNELGDFDVGIEFGTAGLANDDIQSTSFVLSHDIEALSLDMLSFADFGLRYTSVGLIDGDRDGAEKIGGSSSGVAVFDSLDADENGSDSLDLLLNDQLSDGATITSFIIDGTSYAAGSTAAFVSNGKTYGSLTVMADGTATLVADGADVDALSAGESVAVSFSYEAVAPDLSSATADAVATINGVNDAPAAAPVAVTGDEDTIISGVLTATDAEGDALVYALVSGPANGSVVVNPDGGFDYTPDADFFGTDSFVFSVSDGLDSDQQSVTITVNDVQDSPDARDDLFEKGDSDVLAKSVLPDNGSGADVGIGGLQVVAVNGVALTTSAIRVPVTSDTGMATGSLRMSNSGFFTFNGAGERLDEGERETFTFTYTIEDSTGGQDTAMVTIVDIGDNDGPSFQGFASAVVEDTAETFRLFSPITGVSNTNLYFDPEGDNAATITILALPTNGVVTLSDGSSVSVGDVFTPDTIGGLRFTPNDLLTGSAEVRSSIRFQIADDRVGDIGVKDGSISIRVTESAVEGSRLPQTILVGGSDSETLEAYPAQGGGLFGSGGDDVLIGTSGDQLFNGGTGDDEIHVSSGFNDYVIFEDGMGNDTVFGGTRLNTYDVSDFGFASLGDFQSIGSDGAGGTLVQLDADDSITFAGIDFDAGAFTPLHDPFYFG